MGLGTLAAAHLFFDRACALANSGGEHVVAVVGHQHFVFDANATDVGKGDQPIAPQPIAGQGCARGIVKSRRDLIQAAITSAICGPKPRFCVCFPAPDGSAVAGVVYLDGEGRVVDNTMLFGTNKQAWLDGLANESWLCLADHSVLYSCSIGE